MNKVHVKTGDTVKIISGRDRGKQGKVPRDGRGLADRQVSPERQLHAFLPEVRHAAQDADRGRKLSVHFTWNLAGIECRDGTAV